MAESATFQGLAAQHDEELLCVELTALGHMATRLRRGARLAPRVLAADGTGVRACLVPTQAGPLAGDHDRVRIGVGAGATLIVRPIGAACALAGSAPSWESVADPRSAIVSPTAKRWPAAGL